MVLTYLVKLGHWFYVNTRFGRWYFNRSLEQISASFPLGHSAPITVDYGNYHVRVVSYSRDNYGFIIWRDFSKKCVIVDPGYFQPFHEIIQTEGFILDFVLITHKHYDHCGGITSILDLYPNTKIVANRKENLKNINTFIDEPIQHFYACKEDYLDPFLITAYYTPGHTVGHTIFAIKTSSDNLSDTNISLLVFSGDAIFMGSIGAMFECSTKMNIESLNQLLINLLSSNIPTNKIMIFPGHEYSIDSMHFLLYNCCPKSVYAKTKLEWCYSQRNWLLPTIPMTLFDELNYSPYLRIAISTKSTEEFKKMVYLTSKNETVQFCLPKLENLLHEILLSKKFVKKYLLSGYSSVNEDVLKEKLLEELFNETDKILLSCDHCRTEQL